MTTGRAYMKEQLIKCPIMYRLIQKSASFTSRNNYIAHLKFLVILMVMCVAYHRHAQFKGCAVGVYGERD